MPAIQRFSSLISLSLFQSVCHSGIHGCDVISQSLRGAIETSFVTEQIQCEFYDSSFEGVEVFNDVLKIVALFGTDRLTELKVHR